MSALPFQPTELFAPGYKWNTWAMLIPGTTPLDDLLKPEAWAHVARWLTVNDTLVVKSEAGLFVATLNVRRVFVGGADVACIERWDAPEGAVVINKGDGLKVEFVGGKHKWRVVNGATSEVLAQGFDSKGEADGKRTEIAANLGKKAAA